MQLSTLTAHSYSYDENHEKSYYKLFLPHDERPHGYMLPEIVRALPWTSDFKIDHDAHIVELSDSSEGEDTTTVCDDAFKDVVTMIVEQDLFEIVHAQHSELIQILIP